MTVSEAVAALKELRDVLESAHKQAIEDDNISPSAAPCDAADYGMIVDGPTFKDRCLILPTELYAKYNQAWAIVKSHLPETYTVNQFGPLDRPLADAVLYLDGAFQYVQVSTPASTWLLFVVATLGVGGLMWIVTRNRR
jgi:hypothetical protein